MFQHYFKDNLADGCQKSCISFTYVQKLNQLFES